MKIFPIQKKINKGTGWNNVFTNAAANEANLYLSDLDLFVQERIFDSRLMLIAKMMINKDLYT